jgi:hypothetical protein
MDEEQEILQSSLEQSNKISIGSFFGSPIGGLANRAISQSNTSLKSSIANRNLIATLQASIELLRGQLQQITTYVLLDRQERGRIVKQKETEAFEREDQIQKGIIRPENAQPRGLEDSLPFFPEARFSEGLTAGMSSIGERQGVAEFQERFVEGSRPFFFGRLVPGSGNADTVNAKLTPGEFVIPKDTVEKIGVNSLTNLIKDGNSFANVNEEKVFNSKEFFFDTSTPKTDKNKHPRLQNFERDMYNYGPGSEERKEEYFKKIREVISPNMLEQFSDKDTIIKEFSDMNKSDKSNNKELIKNKNVKSDYFIEGYENDYGDAPTYVKDADGKFVVAPTTKQLTEGFSTYGDDFETPTTEQLTKGFSTYGDDFDSFDKPEKKEDKGIFGGLFSGNKKNENVRSDDKGKGLFGGLFGGDQIRKGEAVVKGEGKPEGFMRGLAGVGDFMTSGIFDLDKRGDSKLDTARKGAMDFVTGGMFDFDKKGDSKLQRVQKGMMDFVTGGVFDFDKKGDSKLDTARKGVMDFVTGGVFDLDRRGDGKEKNKSDVSGQLTRKDFKSDEDFEFYKNNFGDLGEDSSKINQLPMKTTVNPDGSITSRGSGTLIGGELVKPGQPLSKNQKAGRALGSLMGNTEKEMTEGFSTYPSKSETPSIEPANQSNLKVAPSESIKTAAQGLMTPPPPPQSETIELPPQTQGDAGGGGGIQGGVPQFKPSTPSHDPLSGTESPLIFVEVISNPFLSIP